MLNEICGACNNYFCSDEDKHFGTYKIENRSIALDFLKTGQYFRIVGSVLNDGIYQYGATTNIFTDEEFEGSIWALSIPKEFITLAEEIKTFCESEAGAVSPYNSESFGGYTYSRATGSNGTPATWQEIFSKKLNRWRKI